MTVNKTFQPFGGDSILIKTMSTADLVDMYKTKCNQDVSRHFHNLSNLSLHECTVTGMRFWRPASVAGDEQFYKELSENWQNYYQTDRWEYQEARTAIVMPHSRVLELGCGRGYFLRSLESLGHVGLGLELNADAALNKVTGFDIRNQYAEEAAAAAPESFDVVCSFQVLEHVPDPRSFIEACIRLVRPGGKIILSTPNYEFPVHAKGLDAFDLPPHHLNHFTAATYKNMAPLFGLELSHVTRQINIIQNLEVAFSNSDGPIERNLRWYFNKVLRLAFGQREVLGHTILAVFVKPESK
jgi:2-polyprenyl-3-methyl-5-hydroxy-6-metoxy-1,4-benzoquinol methylase